MNITLSRTFAIIRNRPRKRAEIAAIIPQARCSLLSRDQRERSEARL